MPTVKLSATPEPTKTCHFSLHTSERSNQVRLPRGKKNPTIIPRIITSSILDMPLKSSSVDAFAEGSSPALLSIHASSMLRNVSGEGMASGAKPSVRIDANCVRSVSISDCVKPV